MLTRFSLLALFVFTAGSARAHFFREPQDELTQLTMK
jgi:hypothetical protein